MMIERRRERFQVMITGHEADCDVEIELMNCFGIVFDSLLSYF